MVTTIAHALARIKDDLPGLIQDLVTQYLAEHPFRFRRRILDPLTVTQLFIQQVLHGNTAITHLFHLVDIKCSGAAYCRARARLPLALIEYVSTQLGAHLRRQADAEARWLGHRVWIGDGTSFSMPDTPELQAHFGQSGAQAAGCGFPTSTTLVLCDAAGFITRALPAPLRTHDASQLRGLHDCLGPGDVLLYDRAGCSYAHLALLSRQKTHAIIRMHQKQIVSFRAGRLAAGALPKDQRRGQPTSVWVQKLGRRDQLVRWQKPAVKPDWLSAADYDALPAELLVRELRYQVHAEGCRTQTVTLVTTLLGHRQYPAGELAKQYQQRWEIETNFRDLKRAMNMHVLKCQSVAGVLKEVAVFTLVYNLVQLVRLQAARTRGQSIRRVSFTDALRWLRHPESRRELTDLVINTKRPGRVEPRVVKRRTVGYSLMTHPRDKLRKSLEKQGAAA